ncbi:MAG: hypothetical protein AAF495_03490 [Pseudomonadota bacterium]
MPAPTSASCDSNATVWNPANGAPGPLVVDSTVGTLCVAANADPYVYSHVHVLEGGSLVFLDPGDNSTTKFQASSILVQKGGAIQAGSYCDPYGASGAHLQIGLWGDDPTVQGTTGASAAIHCQVSDGMGGWKDGACLAADQLSPAHYCTGTDPTDPCNSTTKPATIGDNALLESYGNLPFDNPMGTDPLNVAFGYKTFGVSYGGQLLLFGAKGVDPADRLAPGSEPSADMVPPSDPSDVTQWAAKSGRSWVRLNANAAVGATSLTLDRMVDWAEGDTIVVATSDWHPSHSETVTLSGSQAMDLSIPVNTPGGNGLAYAHHGTIYQVPDSVITQLQDAHPNPSWTAPNTEVETRTAVGLLSRSITVESLGDLAADSMSIKPFPAASDCGEPSVATNPNDEMGCYFGGHVSVRQGFGAFQVQGVEFKNLGQGGRMGHYPVHFHLAKYTGYTDAFLKDSSIWNSNTRFVTVHGTHDVTLARNVGFRSVGHGFYLEDGSEINNNLWYNLGISARGALKEYYQNQDSSSDTYRYIPPILEFSCPNPSCGNDITKANIKGADTWSPVMFWSMNQYNDFVGNAAAGVHGFGSCFWLLGSGLSGPSLTKKTWTSGTTSDQSYADFNKAGARQAPLQRFRGNHCTTAAYGLQTSLDNDPTTNGSYLASAVQGYNMVPNPYLAANPLVVAPPTISGDFKPAMLGSSPANPTCSQGLSVAADGTIPMDIWEPNTEHCVATVIDRFTTSFNWSQVNFGSVWLRPQWYIFLNSAITDQLNGGLGFVGGGSWPQVPPGFFDLTKDTIFAGSTRDTTNYTPGDDSQMGPKLVNKSCAAGVCLLPLDGTGIFIGALAPKRLMTIYDGPFYAEGSIFTNTPAVLDTTGIPNTALYTNPSGKTSCDGTKYEDCGVYKAGQQPAESDMTVSDMMIPSAGIGWKQPNGFYYPPAFAFLRSAFDDQTLRHNVIDQYLPYFNGSPVEGGAPAPPPMPGDQLFPNPNFGGITPIDFSTILNDLDGTLTGMVVEDSMSNITARTSSVSQNRFFDAPAQDPECGSFGVQTSSYDFSTTVMSKLKSKAGMTFAGNGPWFQDYCSGEAGCTSSNAWNRNETFNAVSDAWDVTDGGIPAIPIYRQYLLPDEAMESCTTVCTSDGKWACDRATFMMGTTTGSAPYLTVNHGLFYIDTSPPSDNGTLVPEQNGIKTSRPIYNPTCVPKQSNVVLPGFKGDDAYVVWNIFPNKGTNMTYQIHLGSSFDTTTDGTFVRVFPHLFNGDGNNLLVKEDTTYPTTNVTSLGNGVFEIKLDYSQISTEFSITSRDANEVCMPRDICELSGSQCVLSSSYDGDPQLADTLGEVCNTWGTVTSGELSYSVPERNMITIPQQSISLTECPAEGCLGYAFKLPSDFAAKSYADAGSGLTAKFSDQDPSIWGVNLKSVDTRCPVTTQNTLFTDMMPGTEMPDVPDMTPDPTLSPIDRLKSDPTCHMEIETVGKEHEVKFVVCTDGFKAPIN